MLNRKTGNFSTNLTRLSLNYRLNTFDKENVLQKIHSFTLTYQLYNEGFLGIFQFGGYNPEDINIYGRHQIETGYEFTSHLKKLRYTIGQEFFLHFGRHPSAEIFRLETTAIIYLWKIDLAFFTRFSFGYDDYNYCFLDSYPRFSVGLTWDWFTPFVIKSIKPKL